MTGFFSEESLNAIKDMLFAEPQTTAPAPDTKSCQKKKPDIQKPVEPKPAQTAPAAPKPEQPRPQQPQQPQKVEPKKPPCPA
jgi:hypothetical protein